VAARAPLPYCGYFREPGKLRTSAIASIRDPASRLRNSSSGRVECPIVQIVSGFAECADFDIAQSSLCNAVPLCMATFVMGQIPLAPGESSKPVRAQTLSTVNPAQASRPARMHRYSRPSWRPRGAGQMNQIADQGKDPKTDRKDDRHRVDGMLGDTCWSTHARGLFSPDDVHCHVTVSASRGDGAEVRSGRDSRKTHDPRCSRLHRHPDRHSRARTPWPRST
jgi:hypothetical protein